VGLRPDERGVNELHLENVYWAIEHKKIIDCDRLDIKKNPEERGVDELHQENVLK
jgi:hypothetical protein